MKRTDIYRNGEYFTKHPDWDAEDAVWKVAWIKKLLDKNDIRFEEVADIGCGAGKVLEGLQDLYPSVKSFTGYDISPQAIELAKQIQHPHISFLNEDFTSAEYLHTHLLLTIDVLEHVADYYGFLEKLKGKSNYFIFHIPLDLCCRTILKPHVLLQQRESVGHIHYFSKEMVMWMLQDTGYEVIDWFYTKPLTDLLPQSSIKNKLKKSLRNISFSVNPGRTAHYWGNYSIMILAK
jgi:SAM-dependent methyltransferase